MTSKAYFIGSFHKLAVDCERHTNPEDIHDRFEEGLKLLLDAKLPRADSDEELAQMIQRSIDDPRPSLSTDEVFDRLKTHRHFFQNDLERFRAMLRLEAFDSAAFMLAPGWFFGPKDEEPHPNGSYRITNSTHGPEEDNYHGAYCKIEYPLSSIGKVLSESYAPTPALAMLAAIMRGYGNDSKLWRR